MISAIGIVPGYVALFRPTTQPDQPPGPKSQSSEVVVPAHQKITGDGNIQIGNIGDVNQLTINQSPSHDLKEVVVLDNAGQPTLVLKSVSTTGNPLIHANKPENHLGIAPVNTEIRVLDTPVVETPNPMLAFQKIEVLDGPLKGQVGWVSKNTIRTKEFAR